MGSEGVAEGPSKDPASQVSRSFIEKLQVRALIKVYGLGFRGLEFRVVVAAVLNHVADPLQAHERSKSWTTQKHSERQAGVLGAMKH